MTHSEQLEREAEQNRAQFERTLEELRARFTPGQMVDQLVDYARNGSGSEFIHNLGRRTVENPLPVVLVGTGLAWLMMTSGNGTRHYRGDGEARHLTEAGRAKTAEMLESARSTKAHLAEKAHGTAADLSHRAEEVGRSVSERASSAYGSASTGVRRATESAAHLSHDAAERARSMYGFMREQPLVLAGLGLALGAAIGATFPTTEAESRMMGESSRDLKSNIAKRMSASANGSGDSERAERFARPTEQRLPAGSSSPGATASPASPMPASGASTATPSTSGTGPAASRPGATTASSTERPSGNKTAPM